MWNLMFSPAIRNYGSLERIELTFSGLESAWVASTLGNVRSDRLAEVVITHLAQDMTSSLAAAQLARVEIDTALYAAPFANLKLVEYRAYCDGPQDENGWRTAVAQCLAGCEERGILRVSVHECQ